MSLAFKDFANSSAINLAIAAAIGSTFTIASNDANAAEQLCMPTSEMKAHLNGKGQVGLVAFEQQGSDPSKFVLRAVYATPNGDRATEIVGEMPRDPNIPANKLQLPPTMCKDGEYTDVKLSMNELKVIPRSFYEKDVSPEAADIICKQRQWGDCGPYNKGMDLSAQKANEYPMLKMTSAEFRTDGSIAKLGANYTLSAAPTGERLGDVELGYGGVSKIFYDIKNASYLGDSKLAFSNKWPIVVAEASNKPSVVALATPSPKQ